MITEILYELIKHIRRGRGVGLAGFLNFPSSPNDFHTKYYMFLYSKFDTESMSWFKKFHADLPSPCSGRSKP